MDANTLISSGARAVASLAPAVASQKSDRGLLEDVRAAIERGRFTPAEDERIHAWFARYLTARAGLLETIHELSPIATGKLEDIDEKTQLRGFVVAYAAACLLVRAGRFLVATVATHKVVQRKLNEAEPCFRIPRKQYTLIRKSLTEPANAWRLHQASSFANANRGAIAELASDPQMADVVQYIKEAEESLDVDLGFLVRARLRFRLHSLRRRRASAVQQAFFAITEAFGRVIAELRNPWHVRRVNEAVQRELVALLEPGDVFVLRRDHVASNLFLPGYWPHAALHLGPPSVRSLLQVAISDERAARWVDPMRVLEARKDGVLLRAIPDALEVDSVAVIRPKLDRGSIARALAAALSHEGKLYNFDFDFFRADRLVCTEVVYRAYDGIGGVSFELTQRSGRPTFTAEDLLDMAVDGRGFAPVAVFGTEGCHGELVTGPGAREVLIDSYRPARP